MKYLVSASAGSAVATSTAPANVIWIFIYALLD
jgi:hypothetical protein